MKTIKKTLALILALTMVLAMSANVLAWTVTINPNSDDAGTHTYQAYQIFTGDVAEEGGSKILSNIGWGANVDQDQTKLGNLAAAINAITKATGTDALTAASEPADFADAISALSASDDAQAVADAFGAVLTGTPAASGSSPITIADSGYYLIKDRDGSLTDQVDAAYTRYILQVVSNVTVDAKSEVPSVDKVIDEGSGVKVNEASIGDTIPYKVTSAVPNMTGYDKYYFILNDVMSKGLNFNNDVAISIGGTPLTAGDDFYVEYTVNPTTHVTSIMIVFKNFIQYKTQKGASIVVTYSAELDEQAKIVPDPNTNTVDLTFSNDPNFNYQGNPSSNPEEPNNPDEPGPNEPTGLTPESKTETYTTELTVTKVDEAGNILTGAEFTLTGAGVNIVLVTSEEFTADASGEYWKLKNGTYTTDDPSDPEIDEDLYEDTTTKYAKTTTTVAKGTNQTSTTVSGMVGDDGKVTFTGLGAGEYTLTETQTPAGYNTEAPITFTVTFDPSTKEFNCDNDDIAVSGSKLSTTVVNQKGNTLPTTGGMGTTLFYVLGTLMALGACVVLISRKRAGAAA